MTTWQKATDATPGETLRSRSGIAVSRYQGTVVVSIHGDLDGPRCGDLGYMLADLIDGQGNRSIIIDLRDATATDPQRLTVFTDAAARARRRGAVLRLDGAPAFLEALRQHGVEPVLGSVDIEQLDP
jgi:anti-anti-sigma regulatory factor